MKSETLISALVRESDAEVMASEARLGVADGADAVMFDLSEIAPESRTEETCRKLVLSVAVPAMFCCYDLSAQDSLPQIDEPMLAAARVGAAYVDVSPSAVPDAKKAGAKVILSEHLLSQSANLLLVQKYPHQTERARPCGSPSAYGSRSLHGHRSTE